MSDLKELLAFRMFCASFLDSLRLLGGRMLDFLDALVSVRLSDLKHVLDLPGVSCASFLGRFWLLRDIILDFEGALVRV